MEKYLEVITETKEKVLCYATANNWQVVKQSNGVVITFHQEAEIPAKIFKAECEVEQSPREVFEYIAVNGSSSKPKLQKSIKSAEVLEEINENTFIMHTVSNSAGGGIISPREYLDLVFNHKDESSLLSCVTGIDIDYPRNPKYVQGRNYPSGILCLPVIGCPEKTRVVYIIHTDLGGHIPTKIIDIALPSIQMTFFSNLRKALKESRSQS